MAVRLRRGLQLVRAFYATKPFPPSKSFSSSSGNLISQNLRGCSQLWRLIPSLGPSEFLFGRRMVSTLRPLYSPVDTEGSGGGRSILFEGCDYEHWLITMEFPDPQPTREEKIDTFVKTLAKVVGTEEEAKKRIYALSTTTYTGFQAQISEETSEKMKGLPGVVWVLPDSYIDPVNKEYGGDKYINGVIIPDTRVYNNRPSGRYNDRPRNRMRRDSMPIERRDGLQGDRKDYRSPMEGRGYIPGGDRQDYRPTPMEGRGPMPGDRQEYRPPPMDGRGPVPGDRQDYRAPPMDGRGPIPGDRQDYRAPPVDGRGPIPGARQDYRSPPVDGRGPIPGDRQDYRPLPVDGRGPMPGDRQDYRPPPVDGRGPMPWDRQDYRPPPVDVRGPMPGDRQDYRPPPVGGSGPMPGDRQDYRPSPVDGRGPMPGDRQDYRPSPVYGSGPMPGGQQDYRPSPMEGRGPVSGYRQDYRQPMDGRGPMPHDRPSGPMQGGPMQQEDRDYGFPRESPQGGSTSAQGRDPVQVEQQPFPWPMDGGR